MECTHCGNQGVSRTRGLHGFEVIIAIFLFFLGIIPGIIYYIWAESRPYCFNCGKRL